MNCSTCFSVCLQAYTCTPLSNVTIPTGEEWELACDKILNTELFAHEVDNKERNKLCCVCVQEAQRARGLVYWPSAQVFDLGHLTKGSRSQMVFLKIDTNLSMVIISPPFPLGRGMLSSRLEGNSNTPGDCGFLDLDTFFSRLIQISLW